LLLSSVNQNTARVDDHALDVNGGEPARKPEAVVAGFVDGMDGGIVAQFETHLGFGDFGDDVALGLSEVGARDLEFEPGLAAVAGGVLPAQCWVLWRPSRRRCTERG